MISPGYAYERAPDQSTFLNRKKSKELFRDIFRYGKTRRKAANGSSTSRRCSWTSLPAMNAITCTPWGKPTRNVFGWQRPCYCSAKATRRRSPS